MFEDNSNIAQYIYFLIFYGLIPCQPKITNLDQHEKEASKLILQVNQKLMKFGDLKSKLRLTGQSALYKAQVLFTAMLVFLPQLKDAQGSINYIKKSLTAMYLPDKSKDEKEGAFYKEVQFLLSKRDPELNLIWQFLVERPLTSYSDEELKRLAHLQHANESLEKQPAQELTINETFDAVGQLGGTRFFDASLDNTLQTDGRSVAQTADFKRSDESTAMGSFHPGHDTLLFGRPLNIELQAATNFRKTKDVLETSGSFEFSASGSFVQVLKRHVEVILK